LQRCAPEVILFLCVNLTDFEEDLNVQTIYDLLTLHALQKKQHHPVIFACFDYWINSCKQVDIFVSTILDHEFSQKPKLSHLHLFLQYLYHKNVEETSKIIANRIVGVMLNPKHIRSARNFIKEFIKAGFRVDFQFGVLAKNIFEVVRTRINQRELFNDEFNSLELLKNSIGLCAVLPIAAAAIGGRVEANNVRRSGGTLNSFQTGSLNRFHSQLQQFMISSAEFLRWAATAE
uniref:Uncharacterized protein n=1 Tax=Panagrolaimus sp. JU765 TaxID=591449 RepID=A0AC34RBP2_9BILA